MSTIVTAFLTKINHIGFRNYETYIDYGKKILRVDVPCVCFLERDIYEKYFVNELKDFPQTYFIMFEKHEMYLYEYLSQVTHYDLSTDNRNKDTIDYMFLQCYKSEFLRKVAVLDPFQTSNFTWIDFGIFHMIKNDDQLTEGVRHVSQQTYANVRAASCRDPNEACPHEDMIYRQVMWFFAGSVIGGNKDMLIYFADKMKQKCIDIITTKHHIMWEINIWYLLFHENKGMFSPYHCNHNLSILMNY